MHEEFAKSKGKFCDSKRSIQNRNMVVKGGVIPCMLSLIKYVQERKCALFYARPHISLSTNQAVDQHIQVRIFKLNSLLPSYFTSPWTVIPSWYPSCLWPAPPVL